MDTVATIIQVLLGVAFVGAGAMHLRFARGATPSPQMAWVTAVPPNGLAVIALLELVGGAVLAATPAIGPAWLAGLTAVCFVALMVAATIFHLRPTGEAPNAIFNLLLAALAPLLAYSN